MTEKEFVRRNKEKWLELEDLLKKNTKDADQLHDLFIKVSSDLSYARTFFPNRSVRQYLNNLTNQVFNSISKEKRRFHLRDIIYFYRHTLPQVVYRHRRAFITSAIVFILSFTIGVLSTQHNEDFANYILSDEYVAMTEENINEGDPMKVYKDKAKIEMALSITANNILVAFNAFVLGLLGTIGTVYILMYNGIMIGAFQYFFYSKGLFWTSFLTIWIHGTIEISAIIIAGAAGIVLGNGILFPKTYHRTSALQLSAQRAITILFGTVPLFIVAGLLEGFVTRLTDLPVVVKAGIIIGSLIFIGLIFVVYPYLYMKSLSLEDRKEKDEILPISDDNFANEKYALRSFGDVFAYAFARYRNFLLGYLGRYVLPITLIFSIFSWVYYSLLYNRNQEVIHSFYSFGSENGRFFPFFIVSLIIAGALFSILRRDYPNENSMMQILVRLKIHFPYLFVLAMIFYAPIYFISGWWMLLIYFLITPQLLIFVFESISDGEKIDIKEITNAYGRSWYQYLNYILPIVVCYILIMLFQFAINSGALDIISNFLKWHRFLDEPWLNAFWIESSVQLFFGLLFFPLIVFIISSQYYTEVCKNSSIDLLHQAENFGTGSNIFELNNQTR